jgi:hypothetical protein
MNYSVGTIVCLSLGVGVCVCVCDEYEIIADHNYKEKRLFTLHLRESQILNCLVIGKMTKPVEKYLL